MFFTLSAPRPLPRPPLYSTLIPPYNVDPAPLPSPNLQTIPLFFNLAPLPIFYFASSSGEEDKKEEGTV